MWSFAYASKGSAHPIAAFDAERSRQFTEKQQLRYYNEAVHSAAFALPNFVRELLV
jgi:spermidine synthase